MNGAPWIERRMTSCFSGNSGSRFFVLDLQCVWIQDKNVLDPGQLSGEFLSWIFPGSEPVWIQNTFFCPGSRAALDPGQF